MPLSTHLKKVDYFILLVHQMQSQSSKMTIYDG